MNVTKAQFEKMYQMKQVYEMCSCGHFGGISPLEAQSHNTNFPQGHGDCIQDDCSCKQFTWTGHVDKNGEAFVIMFEGVDCQELEELRKLTDLDRSNKKND